MLVCILFLAGKDATSYKLKSKIDNDLTKTRINRWHRDGVVLNILFVLPFIYFDLSNWIFYLVTTLLLRLSFFDLGFNYWGGLDYDKLGSTALVDKFFVRIFGENGAVEKSLVFFALLILFNIFI